MRVNGCAFIQEIKMQFQVFSLLKIQLSSLLKHSHSRFSPGTSQPENAVELRDKPTGNAPETLYTVRSGLFRSGCNRCTTLPKSFMRPLPYSNENSMGRALKDGRIYCLPPTLLLLIAGIPAWFCFILFAHNTTSFFPFMWGTMCLMLCQLKWHTQKCCAYGSHIFRAFC